MINAGAVLSSSYFVFLRPALDPAEEPACSRSRAASCRGLRPPVACSASTSSSARLTISGAGAGLTAFVPLAFGEVLRAIRDHEPRAKSLATRSRVTKGSSPSRCRGAGGLGGLASRRSSTKVASLPRRALEHVGRRHLDDPCLAAIETPSSARPPARCLISRSLPLLRRDMVRGLGGRIMSGRDHSHHASWSFRRGYVEGRSSSMLRYPRPAKSTENKKDSDHAAN